MAVTYPIDFPSEIYLNGFNITSVNAVSSSQSPFDYTTQTFDFGGEIWQVSGSLPPMSRTTSGPYRAFVTKLKGQLGSFLLPMPETAPLGVGGGTPIVNGASQDGDELDISGAPTSTAGWLKAGDWLQLGSGATTRLHQVLDDVDTDGSGEATINIYPSLRSSPANGASVVINNCKGLFKLDSEPAVDLNIDKFYLINFTATEYLDGT